MLTYERLAQSPAFTIGRVGPLIVQTYTEGGASLAALAHIEAVHGAHLRTYPRFASLAIVTGVKLTPPPEPVRTRAAELDTRFQAHLFASAVVLESQGLAAVVARSFLSAFSLLTPRPHDFKTFKEVDAAVAWVQQHPEQWPDLKSHPDLLAEVNRARLP